MWFYPLLLKNLACSTSACGVQGPPQRGTCHLSLTSSISLTTYPTAALGHLFPTLRPSWFSIWALCAVLILSAGSHVWASITLLPLLGFKGDTANQHITSLSRDRILNQGILWCLTVNWMYTKTNPSIALTSLPSHLLRPRFNGLSALIPSPSLGLSWSRCLSNWSLSTTLRVLLVDFWLLMVII